MKLNLGCGPNHMPGFVNVDCVPIPGVDVVHDLDVHPWPWTNDSVQRIEAEHVFEHIDNPIGFMTESHRVLKPGGYLHIVTPHYLSRDAFTDPTHKRHCTEHTFDYWTHGTVLFGSYNVFYGAVAFHPVDKAIVNGNLIVSLRKVSS